MKKNVQYNFMWILGSVSIWHFASIKIAAAVTVVGAGENKKQKMKTANSLIFVIAVVLFCGSTVGLRPKLFSGEVISPAASDGICVSMVEKQNYVCEEHKVTFLDSMKVIWSDDTVPQNVLLLEEC